MTQFDIVFGIKAPPQQVLAVLFAVERWPEWTSSITSIRRLDAGPLAVGSRAKIRQPKLMPAVWKVTELDKPEDSFGSPSPGVRIVGDHLIDAGADGSKAALSLRYSGLFAPILSQFYGRLSEHYLSLEANGLRKRCEGS
jgi:hypothetical protein